jgi:hypothetical protein
MMTMYVTTNSNAETAMVEMMGGGNNCEDKDDAFDDVYVRLRVPGKPRHIDRSAYAIMEEEEDDKDPPCLDLMCGIESRRRVARMAKTIS